MAEMSRAYATALDISFEVRGGLFVRQMHHWAALLFMMSMVAHMMRIFFTGAFRRPREANWIIGCTLILLGMVEGFMGYSLPDDLLSGVGLRIMSAIILAVPILGTWVHWAIFGGDFPSDLMLDRFYILHVLVLPGLILANRGTRPAGLVPEAHPVPWPWPHREQRCRHPHYAGLRNEGYRYGSDRVRSAGSNGRPYHH
ncbi:ubiquinol-cytochrome c reductase cytochrome b subunit [Corynebacterium pilosum]|uniref:Cytochrome bc1 complex cytochrome b subunit n=1 Tax=Corynebacterium pilosum TaxID=35756 RepID=A0A376GYK4_9CORY|nr:ubiquinol-cytochrome c reductase cytochrome b subunit [Corynebacterium pilosum]